MSDADPIALSLVSHTNAGKTTLARTLLGRDVGEVRDAAHVTTEAARFVLVDTAAGDALELWDTPGFGDSARLAQRLRQHGNPIGWFLTQVWDRYRDRPFWLTQQAVHNVRHHADVVLYLVNAAEQPDDAGYLAPELAVLDWIGQPVIALLNQVGPPRPAADEAADEERWRAALAARGPVREVLTFDAFARCWVQEFTLFAAVERALPAARRAAFSRLVAAWQARRIAQFDDAIAALVPPLVLAAMDRVALPPDALLARLGKSIGITRPEKETPASLAAGAMTQRLEAALAASTERLIAVHGLDGRGAGEALARAAADLETDAPVDERRAAVMGGLVSGALTGLGADLATGGLTFGAGMLAGALVGALGSIGVARGLNAVRGKSGTTLRWQEEFLAGQVTAALLRYLAVAHFGRGRGDWLPAAAPAHWREQATRNVAAREPALAAIWSLRTQHDGAARIDAELRTLLREEARLLLVQLYPGVLNLAAEPARAARAGA